MNITPDEAARSLAAARQAQTQTRKTTAAWAYFLIIWGVYWAALPLLRQALPQISAMQLWLVCLIPCYVTSGFVGRRLGTQMRVRVPSALAWLFTAPVGIGSIWLWFAWPLAPLELGTIVLVLFAFSYMFASMVLHIRQLFGIGVVLGGCVVLAYALGTYIAPNYAWLWQALLQGGGLIGCGVYALWRGASYGTA